MLDHLAPARRRFLLGIAAVVALGVVVAVLAVVLRRQDPPVEPVAQDELGPVLLVPGYGGSTAALEVLAAALEDEGRRTRIIRSPGDPRGDLREHAEALAEAAQRAVDEGAPSVDVVGYSAGGVVVRYWIAELGGGSLARRAVTLASPHHGTDLAGVAAGLAPDACPEACRQLAPDSDLLRELNAGDETPAGPRWVAIWTTDDETVVPATLRVPRGRARLLGAVGLPRTDRHARRRAPDPRGDRDGGRAARRRRAGGAGLGGLRLGAPQPPARLRSRCSSAISP